MAASDHHPVVATFATAPPRRATEIEATIPLEVLEDPDTREMINLLWRRLYTAPPGEGAKGKLLRWTESKRKVSSILLAKAGELRRRRTYAQMEVDAVADARKAQMAAIPNVAQLDSIAELNRKVVDKRRTFSPAPPLAEKIIRAEELVTKQSFRRWTKIVITI